MDSSSRALSILSTWRFSGKALRRIEDALPGTRVVQESATGTADVDRSLRANPDTDVLYTGVPSTIVTPPSRLALIQLHSAGTDEIRTRPMWTWPLPIASGSGITSTSVAELAVSGLLSLRRRMSELHDLQTRATWPDNRRELAGRELYRSSALIIGYGSVGRAVAALLHGFGVRIIVAHRDPARRAYDGYTSPGTGDPAGTLPSHWYDLTHLDDALPHADQVILCAPKSPVPIIGPRQLSLMSSHAVLSNVGRGSLVDTDALTEALAHSAIAGAHLDVTDPEPLPGSSPLWQMPNCLITPHLAGTTHEAAWHGASLLIEQVRRLQAGEPVLNQISRTRDAGGDRQ